jgi:VanZ family protein
MPETGGRGPGWKVELHAGYGLLTLAYMVGIYWLSSHPELGARREEPLSQLGMNLVHIPVYAGLAVCFLQALAGGRATRTPRAPSLLALLGAAGYGALDEWHQSFVPGRSASIGDFLLDFVGIVGILLILRLGPFRARPPGDPDTSSIAIEP